MTALKVAAQAMDEKIKTAESERAAAESTATTMAAEAAARVDK